MTPTIPAVVPPLPHDNPFKRRYAATVAFQWLAAGWRDLLTKPAPSLIYGFVVFAVSAIIVVGCSLSIWTTSFYPP